MATQYKTGSWAVHGRVMPGCRIKAKCIDQILEDGRVVHTGSDPRPLSSKQIFSMLHDFFPDIELKDRRPTLGSKTNTGKSICFYARNINHLGGDWGSEKKRIQIGADFPGLYSQNLAKGVETILLGIYRYCPSGKAGVELFVCFGSETYASRNTNNSAAHIHTIDLVNAQKNGVYRRIDKSGNELLVLNRENFIKHINAIRGLGEVDAIQKDRELLAYLGEMFDSMPRKFNGIECYKEMMAAHDQTRMNQGAWEGWYYEFFVQRYLKTHPTDKVVWWSKKERGELDFDLCFPYREWFYGDVKSDDVSKDVQGNLKESIDFLIKEKGGRLWYIAIEFTPEKDSDHDYKTTRWWNTQLGKLDKLMSYSTRMKYSIEINKMEIFEITIDTLPYLKEYAVSPCAGKPRKLKYKIPNKMKEYLRIYEHT